MKITLDKYVKPREVETDLITVQVGKVAVDIKASMAGGRPALMIRSTETEIAVYPYASNVVGIVAFESAETDRHYVKHRAIYGQQRATDKALKSMKAAVLAKGKVAGKKKSRR